LARQQQIITNIILGLLLLTLVKCANQLSPPGGEVDKIPPTIISTYPENGTLNFNENTVEFTFSEYVNKRNINEAFFISPLIEENPEFSWTNKTVSIEFSDTLKNNSTYSVIIGTEIKDLNNNNNMTEPYVLTFSTGNKIDSGKISGRVFAENADGTLIFAYKIDSGNVNIYKQKPSYISQINDEGFYELNGLGNATYSLYAVKDEFKDLVYNIGDDRIGLPTRIAELNSNNNTLKGFDFFLQKEDTLAPNIQAVTMTDKNHIVVEFNEPIDSSKITTENFNIYDSTSNINYPIKYWFKTSSKNNEYVLCLSDSLSIDNELYLHSINISDKNGNFFLTESANFVASDKPDTSSIKLDKIDTPFERSIIDYISPSFLIYFSDAFDTLLTNAAISMFTPDSIILPLTFHYKNNAQVEVKSIKDLKPKTQYSIFIDMNYFIDLAGNKIDTIIVKRLTTVDDAEFSGASGIIIKDSESNVKVILQEVNKANLRKQIKVDTNNNFNFDRVVPGKYLLWAYIDKDSNNIYSYGKIDSLKYAEHFKFYPDTLNLRPRWPVGDIEIDFTNN